jgi:hypothetical protein
LCADGSVKSGSSKKSDAKCPNAGNPFHECGEHCTAKIKEAEKLKKTDKKSPRSKGKMKYTGLTLLDLDLFCLNQWGCNSGGSHISNSQAARNFMHQTREL